MNRRSNATYNDLSPGSVIDFLTIQILLGSYAGLALLVDRAREAYTPRHQKCTPKSPPLRARVRAALPSRDTGDPRAIMGDQG